MCNHRHIEVFYFDSQREESQTLDTFPIYMLNEALQALELYQQKNKLPHITFKIDIWKNDEPQYELSISLTKNKEKYHVD